MENWTDIIPSVLKAPYTVYKNRKSINYWWKQLQAYADFGNTNIAVLGVAGTGKSVLTSCLYGEINNLNYSLPPTSKQVENRAISLGEWTHLFRVIPGQGTTVRAKGLEESLNKNSRLNGIVYLVNFGYTELRNAQERNNLIRSKGLKNINDIRHYNLEIELYDFRYIANKIIENHTLRHSPTWLCIVCNKADLFFNEIEKAQSYYDINGYSKFSDELKRIRSFIGSNSMVIESLPVSAYQKSFEWNNISVPSQITEVEQASALIQNLVQTLSNLTDYGH
ncbi:MAG: hypothetical protein AAGI23_01615 [Bacteroidota bacterium]